MALDRSAGGVPTQGFFSTWKLLFQRHLGLLALFVCCAAIVIHIIATAFPPFIGINVAQESLVSMIQKAKTLGQNISPTPAFTLLGFSLRDNSNWLDPTHLGFRTIDRSSDGTISSVSFDADLWDSALAYKERNGRIITPNALPTNAWWQPWVTPPGARYS